ncbi:hypothetical protein ACWFR1_14720 [Streptomyces sp. NPDC055103]
MTLSRMQRAVRSTSAPTGPERRAGVGFGHGDDRDDVGWNAVPAPFRRI